MPTIREVAAVCGVSIASVSRILNNDETYKVSPQTRDKVFRVAEELHYAPSPAYQRKSKTKKINSIACIINATAEKNDDSYYTAILEGIKTELAKNDYVVDYLSSQYELDSATLESVLNRGHFNGIILMTTPPADSLKIIQNRFEHIVCVDTSLTQYDNVRYNRFEAGCLAMQYLIENGHKKIAFIGSYIPTKFNLQFGRYDAYRTMMQRYGYPMRKEWILDCNWERQLCYEMTKKLVSSDDLPTAIFFASDYMAIASLSALHEEKIRVPEDISIIGISDIEESKYLSPPLTTISIPQFEIGQIVTSTLLARIKGDNSPPKQIYVPTKLIERKSVAKIK